MENIIGLVLSRRSVWTSDGREVNEDAPGIAADADTEYIASYLFT